MESTPPPPAAPPQLCRFLLKVLLFLSIYNHPPPRTSANSLPLFPKEAHPTKSGYLTVNSTTGSAIFYTFYQAQNPTTPPSQTPILIWLQGGPGCSSMIGNFYELGPWRVSTSEIDSAISLEPNPGSWNRIFDLLFLDNPIGVGFSIASTPEEIPTNQLDIAKHLYIAIKNFIGLDPSYKTRRLYITGESYAGKYIPAIGCYILQKNADSPRENQLNLVGVAVGNGMTDPISQVAIHAMSAYYSGWINEKQKIQLESLQMEAVELTRDGKWSEAKEARSRVMNALENMTGLATLYDVRRQKPYEDYLVANFLNHEEVKRALLVRNETMVFSLCSNEVKKALNEDMMKSVKHMVEFLVKNIKVLLYDGQCDLRFGVVSTEAWVKKMEWEGITKFIEAERKIWRVKGELAGYVQRWGSFSHVVVLGAGHLVPADQALNSQEMIEEWVLERGVFANENTERLTLKKNTNFKAVI